MLRRSHRIVRSFGGFGQAWLFAFGGELGRGGRRRRLVRRLADAAFERERQQANERRAPRGKDRSALAGFELHRAPQGGARIASSRDLARRPYLAGATRRPVPWCSAEQTGTARRKWLVNLLKAFWGAAATPENDFAYAWLPKKNAAKDYSTFGIFESAMAGTMKVLWVVGQSPAVSSPNLRVVFEGLSSLETLVVQEIWETETAAFWKRPGVDPKSIQTEVFLLPGSFFMEKNGSITNSGAMVQWRYAAVKPPGQAMPDGELLDYVFRRVRDCAAARPRATSPGSTSSCPSCRRRSGALTRHLRPVVSAFAKWRDEERWLRNTCPVCGALPAMAQLIGVDPGRMRFLACGCCGSRWRYRRTACPFCEADSLRLGIVTVEGEAELRLDYCEACRGYLKTYNGVGREALLLADWTSIHLDLVARERGLKRLATSLYELDPAREPQNSNRSM